MYNYEYIKIILKELSKLSYRDRDILMRLANKAESVEKIAKSYGLARQRVYQIEEEKETQIGETLRKEQNPKNIRATELSKCCNAVVFHKMSGIPHDDNEAPFCSLCKKLLDEDEVIKQG